MSRQDYLAFEPSSKAFVDDPYPFYDAMRDHGSVFRARSGLFVLTRYADVIKALADPRLSNAPAPFAAVHKRNAHRSAAASVANNLIAFQDAPDHLLPRKIIATGFKGFMRDREPVVRHLVTTLTASWQKGRDIELMEDFAAPLAASTIGAILGIPQPDLPLLRQWSHQFFYLFHAIPNGSTLDDLNRTLTAFRAYVGRLIDMRRKNPGDDLISFLIDAERSGQRLAPEALIDNCMLLLADGIENVRTGLVTSAATLSNHPAELARLRAAPALLDRAVDECLRYESPGQYQGRIANDDLEIGGETIQRYSVVILGLAAANRDPAAFPDPARFDIGRNGPRHLAFGFGPHACLGGALVEMEFKLAFEALFLGRFDPVPSADALDWVQRPGHRWPRHLHLRL